MVRGGFPKLHLSYIFDQYIYKLLISIDIYEFI